MNTQPMDQYLNRERLTDLAQFAVPDGHDLWPKIERAARASTSGMTTQRPGILSLGLSRAWTAVGILLIAATFAAPRLRTGCPRPLKWPRPSTGNPAGRYSLAYAHRAESVADS